MPKILCDLFDLIRFRFQPLAGYVYPAWQPVLWLLLIGSVAGMFATEFQAGMLQKIAFFVALNLIETMLLSLWLMVWLRFVLRRPLVGSLFPLLALCAAPQLLEPVIAFIPAGMAMGATMVLGVFALHLLVSAVAAALGERRMTIFLAILAYMPTAFALFIGTAQLAAQWGWIALQQAVPVTG